MPMRRRDALAACALACIAFPSSAADLSSGGLRPTSAVKVLVEGRIRPFCELPAVADMNLGNLQQSMGSIRVDFPLSCNLPFELDINSGGGLSHRTSPQGEGGFSGSLGYTLDIALPVRGATTSRVAARSASAAELGSGAVTLSTGDDISAPGGSITLTLDRPQGYGLLAGSYRDTIVMTLRPGL